MKSLLLTFSLIAGLNSYATTTDSYSLPINGQESEENFILNAIQNKIEYKQEVLTKTCSRTVLVGQDKNCGLVVVPTCYVDRDRNRVCKEHLDIQCSETPIYNQESYACYETVNVPYEVFSYNAKAVVDVKLPSIPEGSNSLQKNCSVDFKLTGGRLSSTADCEEFIVLANKSATESRDGQTITQNQKFDISLLNLKEVIAPIYGGIKEVRVEGKTLVFRTGDLTKNQNFYLNLYVENKKLLGDKVLIDRTLAPSEYTFEKINDNFGIVKIDLEKLTNGINIKKKHFIKIDIQILTDIQNSINRTLPYFNATGATIINN